MTREESLVKLEGRHKIPEGYRMTTWPAFLRLARWLGFPEETFRTLGTWEEKVVLEYPAKGNVALTVNGHRTVTDRRCPDAFWAEESQAYFELLGIPMAHWTISLKIEFAVGEFPSFTLCAALSVPKDAPADATPGC